MCNQDMELDTKYQNIGESSEGRTSAAPALKITLNSINHKKDKKQIQHKCFKYHAIKYLIPRYVPGE